MRIKSWMMIAACVAFARTGWTINVVSDGEIESKAVPAWSYLAKGTKGVKLGVFEEDLTWNRCLRLDVVKNARPKKTGGERTNATLLLGGTKAKPGWPVVGGRKYKFSFEARGTVAHANSAFCSWGADGKQSRAATSVGKFKVTKEWMQYKGTFTVPDNAVTAALEFKLFADSGKWPGGEYPFPEGSYLLLDKIVLEPLTSGREIWPSRAVVLGEAADAELRFDDFCQLASGRRSANVPTKMTVRNTADGLRFELEMSGAKPLTSKGGIWGGDSAELIICGTDPKADPLHWAVGPDGKTWAADTNPAGATCRMTGAVAGEETWKATFDLPWKSLGFDARPPKGTALRFNVGRNTLSIADRFKRMSVFGFNGGEFRVKSRFAVLYVGAPEGLAEGGDASAFYLSAAEAAEKERVAKLQREPVVVAQMPVTLDPSVPFLPDELMEPSERLVCTAAVNEHAALPVAIANMTDATEEFRVQIVRGYEQVDWQGNARLMPGLKSDAGDVIGKDRITLMRGVRFRDADTRDRGTRYDILSKLDAVSALPVSPKEAGLLWVEIRTDGLKPGLYRGKLLVTRLVAGKSASGKPRDVVRYKTIKGVKRCPVIADDTKEIPIEFEVLPLELDLADFGFCGYAAPHTEMELAEMDAFGAVGSLVSPWGFKFACDAEGKITERRLSPAVRRDIERIRDKAAKRGANPRIVVGYSWYTVFSKAHAKENKLELRSEAYWRAYREYTQFLADTMRELGVGTDDYVVEVIDEPANRKNMTHEEVVNAYRYAKEAAPEMQLLVTEGEKVYFDDLFPYVDLWIFRYVHYDDPKIQGYAKRMRDAGKRLSMYACYTSPRQDPHRYYRQLSWKAAAWGAPFVSLYQYFDNPLEVSFRRTTYGGITYWTDDGLVPSVRQKALEAGLNDVRYMRALERLAAKSSDAGLAQRVKDLIEKSIEEVTRKRQHDPETAPRFRAKCAELVKGLPR